MSPAAEICIEACCRECWGEEGCWNAEQVAGCHQQCGLHDMDDYLESP